MHLVLLRAQEIYEVDTLHHWPYQAVTSVSIARASDRLALTTSVDGTTLTKKCRCYDPHNDAYVRVKNGPALAGHGAEAVRNAIVSTITTLPNPTTQIADLGEEVTRPELGPVVAQKGAPALATAAAKARWTIFGDSSR